MGTTTTKTAPPPPPPAPLPSSEEEKEKLIKELLSYPILLWELIREAVREAESFKSECFSVQNLAENIEQMLRSARMASARSPRSLYPMFRRIIADVSRNFEKTITLVRKCRRRSFLRRLMTMTIVSTADFRELLFFLENSVKNMKWLLCIFYGGGGIMLSLPPIASNDPIFSCIWAFIDSVYMGQIGDKVKAANELASLAKDNDRNKKIIVEEGGVPPLLKLLKDASSVDVQIASATALMYLANDEERVSSIINELGVLIIVQVLGSSTAEVQIKLANLVARMAEHSLLAQEFFARENVIKPLVTLLSMDVFVDEPNLKIGKHSFHSIVQINKELERNHLHNRGFGSLFSMHNANSGSKTGHNKKEKEEEDPEVKFVLKISCAEALWMLARGSVLNSRRITETKGLLCLAKLVEKGQGELLVKCLMVIMEITAAAESNSDLRRAAFRTNSLAAKVVVDQLLKVITVYDTPTLHILAIKSIGSLAKTFTARETRVIAPLVVQLNHRYQDVAAEAAIALEKFASPDNFLCMEHSETIIELKGLKPLRKLLRGNEQTKLHGLIILCYLALHARNIEAQEQAWVLNILELALADRALLAQHPELRELIPKAVGHLNVYHSGLLVQRPSYSP